MVRYVLLSLLFVFITAAEVPGVVVSVTPDIVNTFIEGLLPHLEKEFKNIDLPAMNFPLLSSKTDIVIRDFSMETIKLINENTGFKFKPSRDIELVVQDIEFSLKFNWALKSHDKDTEFQKGSAKLIVNEATLTVSLYVTEELEELIKLNRCEFELNTMKILFDDSPAKGELNWILDAMNRKMKIVLVSEINKSLNSAILALIDQIPSFKKDLWIDVVNWLIFNLRFINSPKIDSSHLEIEIDGTFMKPGDPYPITIPPPTKLNIESKKTIAIYMSEFTVNSLFLALYQANPLKISNNDLGIQLTTNSIDAVIPGIAEELGESQPAEIICKQDLFSPFTLDAKKITNKLGLICQLDVNKKTKVKILAELYSETIVKMGNGIFTGSINKLQVSKLELLEKNLETEFDLENFKEFLRGSLLIARSFISYKIFGSGILLPDYFNLYFTEFNLSLRSGHLLIEATPQYPY